MDNTLINPSMFFVFVVGMRRKEEERRWVSIEFIVVGFRGQRWEKGDARELKKTAGNKKSKIKTRKV